ncbi:MAG: dethiobiotin synthase [Candidatus Omnitrophota bacterium]|jgi:dethiobiotin synthetase|nr:MAG: dethiobiotin synthase [Candidatus Omnitrophota bacterium]
MTMNGLFITGTDTEIGKTLITALLSLGLRKHGMNCCPVKPIATGGILHHGNLISEDVLFYQKVTGIRETESIMNPVCLKRPASPHFAASLEARSIHPPEIIRFLRGLARSYEALLVEGIGGWLVPITEEYSVADFASELGLPVILVSANKLGTLNHTLLTLESMRTRGIEPAGVFFSKPTPLIESDMDANNIETIQTIGHVEILGSVPYLDSRLFEESSREILWQNVKETIQWSKIIQCLRTH